MTEALLVLIGIAAATAVVLGVLCLIKLAELARRASLTSEGVAQLLRVETDLIKKAGDEQCSALRQEFGARLDQGIKAIDGRVEAIGQKLNDDMATMRDEAGKNREGLRHTVEAKLDDATGKQAIAARELREELNASFRRLQVSVAETLTTLGSQQKERLEHTAVALKGLSEKNEKAQETLKQTVELRLDKLREENTNKLEQMRQTVDEKLQGTLEQRLGESFKLVSDQLKQVYESVGEMQSLATGVGDLRRVLTNVKSRGAWAEVSLGSLLDQVMAPEQYNRNVEVRPGSGERVEFAIRLPGQGEDDGPVWLPIDAKFPTEDYERLIEASDRADAVAVEVALKALEGRVKAEGAKICEKYICPPHTTDFAIVYVPTEGLYAEIIRRPGLVDELHRKCRIVVAGPTVLLALLNSLRMGFRTLAIQKRSSEVWQTLAAVKTEFGRYGEMLDKVKKKLGEASDTIDKVAVRRRQIDKKLASVEKLPELEANRLLALESEVFDLDEVLEAAEPDVQGSDIVLPRVAAE